MARSVTPSLTTTATTHTQIGQESKAATKIQASFRGMRERRQRKKEESAALKIQAVHRGRKVKSLFLILVRAISMTSCFLLKR